MGRIEGLKQMTLYVAPPIIKLVKLIAVKEDKPIYTVVDEALRAYVKTKTTAAERKAVGA